MMIAVRCDRCGGAVAAQPGHEVPACLFCGAAVEHLMRVPQGEEHPEPEGWLPFVVSDVKADAAFRTFASSSIWYPSDLRRARVTLRPVLVPAWSWGGALELYWAGLESAFTRSGKRPVAGTLRERHEQVLVPASSALRQAELTALGTFDEGAPEREWPDDLPYELCDATESATMSLAQGLMERISAGRVRKQRGLVTLNTSVITNDLRGRLLLVPVYIGVFRYGDRDLRLLVNGHTAVVVGKAPISAWKVALAVLAVATIAGLAALAFGCAGAAGAWVGR